MGKRKYILTASVIFVIGFGYCLYSTGKSQISEGLPVEEMVKHSETEAHYYIPDAEDLPVEENLPEEEFIKHEGGEEDDTGVRFIYMPD